MHVTGSQLSLNQRVHSSSISAGTKGGNFPMGEMVRIAGRLLPPRSSRKTRGAEQIPGPGTNSQSEKPNRGTHETPANLPKKNNVPASILPSTPSALHYLIVNQGDLPAQVSPERPALDEALLARRAHGYPISKAKGPRAASEAPQGPFGPGHSAASAVPSAIQLQSPVRSLYLPLS